MKYALVNNVRAEATKGTWGLCEQCGRVLVAKCGEKKIRHWAHKNEVQCDLWWENESEWHRRWKDHFPEDWQEYSFVDDSTGERHRADVRTKDGLVLEFQRSFIDMGERIEREQFYRNMLWVVDGTQRKRDYERFKRNIGEFKLTRKRGIYLVTNPEITFPTNWLGSNVPVIFDFMGLEEIRNASDIRLLLYCIHPRTRQEGSVLITGLNRNSFISSVRSGTFLKTDNDQQKREAASSSTNLKNRSNYIYDPRRGRFIRRPRL